MKIAIIDDLNSTKNNGKTKYLNFIKKRTGFWYNLE
jgi:hypothetical protein